MTNCFLDIEVGGDDLLLVAFALDDGPIETDTHVPSAALRMMLKDETITKVAHSTYDWRWFALHGYALAGPLVDTMVMAHTLDENTKLDLGSLVKRHLGFEIEKPLKVKGGRVHFHGLYLDEYDAWPLLDRAKFRRYNQADVETLRSLYTELLRKLKFAGWDTYWARESVPYTPTIVALEARGMPINLEAVAGVESRLRAELEVSRAKLLKDGGLPETFNLNSNPQIVKYLFSAGRFTVKDRVPVTQGLGTGAIIAGLSQPSTFIVEKKGRKWIHGAWSVAGRGLPPTPKARDPKTGVEGKEPSVSSPDLLYYLGHDEWVRELCLTYRKLAKVLTTYVTKFPKIAREGRIYGRYNQAGTVTGRLSSSDPNMQNMPARGALGKEIRGLFQGNLIVGDYDQLEMRLMAHFSEDPELMAVFAAGLDPHERTAEAIFGPHVTPEQRSIGKNINFAIGYGAGPAKVAKMLSLAGYPTNEMTARLYLHNVQGFYHRFYEWKEATVDMALKAGFVQTIGGRRRRLSGQFADVSDFKKASYGARQAVNAIIQGSAADILQRVMLKLDWPGEVELIAQVHDELIWEYSDAALLGLYLGTIQQTAETGHGFNLRVPLVFKPAVVQSWAEK